MFHNNIKFMQWKKSTFILFVLCLSANLAQAQVTLSPDGGHSNQNQINEALLQADEVYLTSGIYQIDNSIFIDSDTILRGDPDAIIQVYEGSDQFFTGMKGLICSNGPVDNVLIEGFQIDGNCDELDSSFSRSAPQYDHDAERAIIIHGQTDKFCNNIVIKNMQIYDCFSDGIHVRMANDVLVHDNFISNCQHEGVFFTSIINGEIFKNKIAGITSDCLRLDNCVQNKVYKNILFSYRGSNSNGAYQGGQNGIQVANAGSSHGYDASNKPTTTTNVEVFDNIFANDVPNAIWVHSIDESQVYLHDNEWIDGTELADMGIPIEGIDYNNMPSKEMSERVFSSIFDLFKIIDFITQVSENDTVILPEGMEESNEKAVGTIEYQTVGNNTTTLVKLPEKALHGVTEVQYEVAGKTATHTLLIGERTSRGIVFQGADIWAGDLEHSRDALKLPGRIEAEDIQVTCLTPKDSFLPAFEITEYEFKPFKINPGIFVIIGIVIFGIIEIGFILRHRA